MLYLRVEQMLKLTTLTQAQPLQMHENVVSQFASSTMKPTPLQGNFDPQTDR